MNIFQKVAYSISLKIFIAITCIFYMIFSFTFWDLRMINWSVFGRGLFMFLDVTLFFFLWMAADEGAKRAKKDIEANGLPPDELLKPPTKTDVSRWEQRLKEVQEQQRLRQEELKKSNHDQSTE